MAVDASKHDGRVAIDLGIALGGETVQVQVTVTGQGLVIRRRGARRGAFCCWLNLLQKMPMPPDGPAKYASVVDMILDGQGRKGALADT